MRTVYLIIAGLLLTFSTIHAQTWQWTHPEANPDANSNNYAHDVEVDSSGNVYVLAMYRDSLFLGGNFIVSGTGSYLAKYNAAGTLLWYKLFNNPDGQGLIYASDMVVNAQGIFVTGAYDPPGTYLCQYNCETGETTCAKPAYNIGSVSFTSQFGELGFFLTKFNTNGTVGWNKLGLSTANNCDLPFVTGIYGIGGGLSRPVITSDKNNNITVAFLSAKYNNGTPASISIGGDIIPIDNYSDATQLVAVKYKPTGVLQLSAHTNGGNGIRDCNSIIADNNGNIFLLGAADDSTYFGSQLFRGNIHDKYYQSTYIAKLSSKGAWLFAKELSDVYSNIINGSVAAGSNYANPDLLAVDANNNVYALVNGAQIILGDSTRDKHNYSCLVKMTNSGSLVWNKFFGNEGQGNGSFAYSLCYSNNSLYINGTVRPYQKGSYTPYQPLVFSTLYFDPYPDGMQSFVAKADLDGNYQWITSAAADGISWGVGVKAYQGNIYTCGTYPYQITNLGNLNGVPSTSGAYQIFFGKLKDQYIHVGAITPTQLIPGCTISVPFTSYGLNFSGKNKFFAELSDANGDFTNATIIGNIKSKNSGAITATIPATLAYGSGYRIRIRSSDTLKTGYNYYAYADTDYALTLTCPPPSSGFASTNITATSATVNWTKVDCASGYRVQYRVKGTTKWTIAGTITNNNTTLFNLTGLTANTTYQWRVATRCKNNGAFSFSAYTTLKKFTTVNVFAAAVSDAIYADGKLVVTVLPNPASSNAILKINGAVKDAAIVITDVAGKTVWKADKINSYNILLPIAHFSAGVYLVKFTNGEEIKMIKLVKQ